MDTPDKLSGGGGASEPSSAASAQPGSVATARFPFPEHELAARMGVPADKIAAARKGLVRDEDWSRIARQFCWSEVGIKNLAAALGCPVVASDVKTAALTAPVEKTAPTVKPGDVAVLTVFNLTIPNQRLVLCRDGAGKAVSVAINPEWRKLFRLGMKIEATLGTSGQWRTRQPRSVGRF